MNRRCIGILICFIICFASISANAKSLSFAITGVHDDIRINIEKRFKELQQQNALQTLTLDELREHIIKAMEPFGYFKAIIDIKYRDEERIAIRIQPGVRTRISSLKIQLIGEGAKNPQILKTIKNLPLHVSDPLLTKSYNKAKQQLINTTENLGYLHDSFKKAEIFVDESKNTAIITWIYDTGPLYYFGQVQFDPGTINPSLLKRYVPFKPGETYSTDSVLKLNNTLSGSGYFSSVLVKPDISETQSVPVLIHLEPVHKYTYTLGAGYGTDSGLRGRAGLNIIPVNNLGHKFNALAQGSFNQNALQAQYIIPGINPVYDQYSLTGNFSNLNYASGNSNALLVSLAQRHKDAAYKRVLSLNSLYEGFHYSFQTNNYEYMVYPKATYSFYKTEDALFTPSGFNLTFNALGTSRFTSNINFFQASLDAKAAYMFEPLRLRLYGHTIQGITATNDINRIPLSLALLLGGMDNLKGYSFNSIGPGRNITYTGFEIQKEVKKNWYVLGFMDSGDVYNPTPRSLQYDAGAGVMWVSPIGPIKVGVAQPITNSFQRIGGASPRLIVSMGPDL